MSIIDKLKLRKYKELTALKFNSKEKEDIYNRYKKELKNDYYHINYYYSKMKETINKQITETKFDDVIYKKTYLFLLELAKRGQLDKIESLFSYDAVQTALNKNIWETIEIRLNIYTINYLINNIDLFNNDINKIKSVLSEYDILSIDNYTFKILKDNPNYGNRILEFKNRFPKVGYFKYTERLFADDTYQLMKKIDISELFDGDIEYFIKAIEKKEIVERIKYILSDEEISLRLTKKHYFLYPEYLSINFIEKIGKERYKKILNERVFYFQWGKELLNCDNPSFIDELFENECYFYDGILETNTNTDIEIIKRADKVGFKKSIFELLNTNEKRNFIFKKFFLSDSYASSTLSEFLKFVNMITEENKSKLQQKYGEIFNVIVNYRNLNDEELTKINNFLRESKENREKCQSVFQKFLKDIPKLLQEQFANRIHGKNQIMLSKCKHEKSGNIDIIKFDGEPFEMLVHAITENKGSSNNELNKKINRDPSNWNSIQGGNNFISTSLITNMNFATYGRDLIYGFAEVPNDALKFIKPFDAGTNREMTETRSDNSDPLSDLSSIGEDIDQFIERCSQSNTYNEIVISRKNKSGEKIRPDYIVCFDQINEASIRSAEYFNIPIYLINTSVYERQIAIKKIEEEKENKKNR